MTETTDPARVAAEKIVSIFGSIGNMHVNDILPDIREAVAAKDAEIQRLTNIERCARRVLAHIKAAPYRDRTELRVDAAPCVQDLEDAL